MQSSLSIVNSTTAVGSTGNILISAISRDQTVSIDGLRIELPQGLELYSPIQCHNFYAPYVGSVSYSKSKATSTHALFVKFENFAVTTTTYDFTVAAGEEAVAAEVISDCAAAGVDVERLATVEDLIADTDIIDGIGIDNINNVFVKVADPSKLSPNSRYK